MEEEEQKPFYPLHKFGYLMKNVNLSDEIIRNTIKFIQYNSPTEPSLLLRQINDDTEGVGPFPWAGDVCTPLRCMGGNSFLDVVTQRWHSVLDCMAVLLSVQFIMLSKIAADLEKIRDRGFVTHLEIVTRMTLKCRTESAREIIRKFTAMDVGITDDCRKVLSEYFFREYVRVWELCYSKLNGQIYEAIRGALETGNVKYNPEKVQLYTTSSPDNELNTILELDPLKALFTYRVYLHPNPTTGDLKNVFNARLSELQNHPQIELTMRDFDRIRGHRGKFNIIAASSKHGMVREIEDVDTKQTKLTNQDDVDMDQDKPSDSHTSDNSLENNL